ncbi:ATP-binding protein [Fusibacter bizertensis]
MKRKLVVSISILIVILVVIGIGHDRWFPSEYSPIKNDGSVATVMYDDTIKSPIKLKGDWTFYPDQLVSPDRLDEGTGVRIKVPNGWRDFNVNCGTYRISIPVDQPGVYGIFIQKLRSSYKIFINGQLVDASGVLSDTTNDAEAYIHPSFSYAYVDTGLVDIVIQVTSNLSGSNGIVTVPEFGAYEGILLTTSIRFAVDLVLSSIFLTLGIYLTIKYVFNRQNRHQLYFGLYNISFAVFLTTQGRQIFTVVFRHFNLNSLANLQFFLIYTMAIAILYFQKSFFNAYYSKRLFKLIVYLQLIGMLILIFPINTVDRMESLLLPVQVILMLIASASFGYVLVATYDAMKKRINGAEYLYILSISHIAYAFLLALNIYINIDLHYIPVVIQLLSVLVVIVLMSYSSSLVEKEREIYLKYLMDFGKIKNETITKIVDAIQIPVENMHQLTNLQYDADNNLRHDIMMAFHREMAPLLNMIEQLVEINLENVETKRIKQTSFSLVGLYELLDEIAIFLPPSDGVKLVYEGFETCPHVLFDESALFQVLFNLLHNAIKFTSKGVIKVSAYVENQNVIVSVSDTGSGFDVQKYRNQEISNLNSVLNTSFVMGNSGVGVGLSYAMMIVEQNQGVLEIDSKKGVGTHVKIRLPRAKEQVQINRLSPHSHYIFNGTNHASVVLLSDQYRVQNTVIELLSGEGYSLYVTDNIAVARQWLKSGQIDLLMIDTFLNHESSASFCQEIRAVYNFVELPIILMSSLAQIRHLQSSFENIYNDLLMKPINAKILISRVKVLLAIKNAAKNAYKREIVNLQNQIEPHFLFNTLNTIIGLSYVDEAKTRNALEYLSTYFRGKLKYASFSDLIPLSEELELVNAYLSIEAIRFEEKLEVVIKCENHLDCLIPSMTIQPLVENAICHGILKADRKGKLELSAESLSDGRYLVRIIDNGIGMTEEEVEKLMTNQMNGIGFSNVLKKLSLISGASLELKSTPNEGTEIKVFFSGGLLNEGHNYR